MFPDIFRAASYHPRRKMLRNEHEKIPRSRNIQANARQIRKYTLHFSSSTDNSVMVRSKIKCMYEIRHIAFVRVGWLTYCLKRLRKWHMGLMCAWLSWLNFWIMTNIVWHLQIRAITYSNGRILRHFIGSLPPSVSLMMGIHHSRGEGGGVSPKLPDRSTSIVEWAIISHN